MDLIIQFAIPVVAGLIGMAVGWGIRQNQVNVNKENIDKLWKNWNDLHGTGERPAYITRNECGETTKEIKEEISKVKKCMEEQAKSLNKVQNFSRWMLIEKEGLSLIEVNKILNGE